MEMLTQTAIVRRDLLAAIHVSGSYAGSLKLRDSPEGIAVSPDGLNIAWGPRRTFRGMTEGTDDWLSTMVAGESPKTISVPGWFAEAFAISNNGHVVAVLGTPRSPERRVEVLSLGQAEAATDLTETFVGMPLAEVYDVSVSASGNIVALGSRSRVAVLEVSSRSLLYAGDGRDPVVSPDGTDFAYIDKGLGFVIRNLKRGTVRRVLVPSRVGGLGAWSPDGRYLFAGVFGLSSLQERLLVIDVARGDACTVLRQLGMDDVAGRFAWLSGSFLSP
jgi:hypothetical protein